MLPVLCWAPCCPQTWDNTGIRSYKWTNRQSSLVKRCRCMNPELTQWSPPCQPPQNCCEKKRRRFRQRSDLEPCHSLLPVQERERSSGQPARQTQSKGEKTAILQHQTPCRSPRTSCLTFDLADRLISDHNPGKESRNKPRDV